MEAKIKSLIDNLLVKTQKRETKWDRVGKTDQFILYLDSAQISIDKLLNVRNNILYKLAIINSAGDIIFNVNGVKEENSFNFADDDYNLLKELHDQIKKAYFKVDETIDGLLGEVQKEGEIGKNDPDDLPF